MHKTRRLQKHLHQVHTAHISLNTQSLEGNQSLTDPRDFTTVRTEEETRGRASISFITHRLSEEQKHLESHSER